ncbi:Panacea domain-containing protein [Candidatus Xenohaliotis californiensis]
MYYDNKSTDDSIKSNVIADFFIKKVNKNLEKEESITHLKLQKILYYSYVWYLVLKKKRIFEDPIEAWPYGPVIRSQYDRLKKYGSNNITLDAIESSADIASDDLVVFLDTIWDAYGQYSTGRLVEKTHEEAPWQEVCCNKDKIITDNAIEDFYALENISALLPENTIIRQGDDGYEMLVLKKEIVDAINTPDSDCEKFDIEELYREIEDDI